MKCSKCGAQLPDGSVFCTKCGTNLAQQTTTKAKLGVSVGLLAAGVAFFSMINLYVAILFAGYVLLKEEDSWLRKAAVRAVGIVVMFAVLSTLVNIGFDVFRFINDILALADDSSDVLHKIASVEKILAYIISGCKYILLVIVGVKALSMKSVRVPFVDSIIDKTMSN